MNDSLHNKNLIAVCGKGGVGKTALTAMMSRVLVESGKAGKLLVIDADPAMGLLTALGIRVNRTMGQVREDIIKTGGIDRTGADTIDINVIWGRFQRQSLSESNYTPFNGGVNRHFRTTNSSGYGGGIDNFPVFLCNHTSQDSMRHHDGAFEIEVNHPVPEVLGLLHERCQRG